MAFHNRESARRRRLKWPLAMVGLVGAIASYHHTASGYFARVAPHAAPQFLQNQPQIALQNHQSALLSVDRTSVAPIASDPHFIRSKASQLLRQQPLNPMALRFLEPAVSQAIAADADRSSVNFGATRNLTGLTLAERVSRRDGVAQLALILAKTQSGDAHGAIAHIDRLFTVNPELIEAITAQLLPLLNLHEGRRIMAAKADRPWFIPFLRTANRETENPVALARFMAQLEKVPADFDKSNPGRLAAKLVRMGEYDMALSLAGLSGLEPAAFARFEPGQDNAQAEFEPLSWRLADNEDGYITLLGDGRIALKLGAGRRLSAMERITRLTSGEYNFEVAVSEREGVDIYWEWEIYCRGESGEWRRNWTSQLQVPDGSSSLFSLEIPPDGCDLQRWHLSLQTNSGQRGSSAEMLLRLGRN